MPCLLVACRRAGSSPSSAVANSPLLGLPSQANTPLIAPSPTRPDNNGASQLICQTSVITALNVSKTADCKEKRDARKTLARQPVRKGPGRCMVPNDGNDRDGAEHVEGCKVRRGTEINVWRLIAQSCPALRRAHRCLCTLRHSELSFDLNRSLVDGDEGKIAPRNSRSRIPSGIGPQEICAVSPGYLQAATLRRVLTTRRTIPVRQNSKSRA